MERVDYVETFIAVADDCPADVGTPPPVKPDNPSVAARTYELIAGNPYRYTSADVIFTVHADRKGIPAEDRPAARQEFYAKPQPCLRSSDLGRRYGWGIHADADGRVALYGVESPEYAEFASARKPSAPDVSVKVRKALRSSRAGRG